MNSQQMMEEIDRLNRLCKEKDEDNKLLRALHQKFVGANNVLTEQLSEAQAQIAMKDAEIKKLEGILSLKDTLAENMELQLSESQAQIAMLAEFIEHLYMTCNVSTEDTERYLEICKATSETVAAWRAKETEPLRRKIAELEDKLNK